MRHLAVGQLWIQEGLRRVVLELYKVGGKQNPADILTKSVTREVLDQHLHTLGLERAEGGALSAPHAQLQSVERDCGNCKARFRLSENRGIC